MKLNTCKLGKDENDDEYILCLRCNMKSYHILDIENLYCGNCHTFHEDEFQKSTPEKTKNK